MLRILDFKLALPAPGIPVRRNIAFLIIVSLQSLVIASCGVIWDSGGKRHALGIGYVSWPIADESHSAAVSGFDVVGAAVLATGPAAGVALGYSSNRIVLLRGDQFVMLDCLSCDLATAHPVGGVAK